MNTCDFPSVSLLGYVYPSEFIFEQDKSVLVKLLDECCELVTQNKQDEATRLFKYNVGRQFFADPDAFTDEFLKKLKEKSEADKWVLIELFQDFVIHDEEYLTLVGIMPEALFKVIQVGENGKKELFQAYEQLAIGQNEKAFSLLQQAADLGNSHAYAWLGSEYILGDRIKINPEKGFEYLMKAEALGSVEASLFIGACYQSGCIPSVEGEMGIAYLEKAVASGKPAANLGLGYAYKHGIGVEKDDNKAFACFLKAQGAMIDRCAYEVAKCYIKGRGTQKNLDAAKTILLDLIWRNYRVKAASLYQKHFESEKIVVIQ